jgi:hypothetical protein
MNEYLLAYLFLLAVTSYTMFPLAYGEDYKSVTAAIDHYKDQIVGVKYLTTMLARILLILTGTEL